MATWESQLPSFIKIFHCGLSSTLRIPIEFVKKYERMLHEISLLKVGSGKSWDVKMRKQRNGQFYIAGGWPGFVEDNQLSERDFLVFKLASKSTLQVMIYGTDCLSKHAEPGEEQNLQAKRKRGRPQKSSITAVSTPMMPESKPTFFKVLIKDFASKLNLPPAFMHKYGKFLPGNVKVRTDSGETWNVEVELADEKCCFTRGWSKFVKDMELEIGEFLAFWLDVYGSILDVSVYGTSGCKREISSWRNATDEEFDVPESSRIGETDKEIAPDNLEHPRVEILMTKTTKSRLNLTTEFAEATKLNRKQAVVLEYPPRKRYWPVILQLRPFSNFSLDMATGWHDFWRENGLEVGKAYSFEFNPTRNVIQVKETR